MSILATKEKIFVHPIDVPFWDDPLTASLAAASATPPLKEGFSGLCIVFSTGRENDGVSGIYYYRNRYYSPTMGRFLSEDPLHSPLRKMSGLSCQSNYAPNLSWYLDVDPGLAMFRFNGFANSFAVDPKQLHLYTYVYNNPVNKIDPEGLYADPQTPGCDQFPDFNRCATQCCNEHDDCYKKAALSKCTSRTWLEQYFPYGKYGSRTRVECEECNSAVVRCLARATWHWGSRRKDPC